MKELGEAIGLIIIMSIIIGIIGSLVGVLVYFFDVTPISKEVIDYEVVAIEDQVGKYTLEAEDIIYYRDGGIVKDCEVNTGVTVLFDSSIEKPVLRATKVVGVTRSGRVCTEYKGAGYRDSKTLVFKDQSQYDQWMGIAGG